VEETGAGPLSGVENYPEVGQNEGVIAALLMDFIRETKSRIRIPIATALAP
jgi:hypothetical protein